MSRKIFSLLKQILAFILSVIILSLIVFYISRLAPIDPLEAYYGQRTEKMSVEEKSAARERLGLNEPIYVQYIRYIQNALQGDFGISYKYKQNVIDVIKPRVGNTLILGGLGFLIIFIGAPALGILCARFEDRWLDKILCKLGTFTSCIPEFWFSLVLILIFCVSLRWLPSSGAYSMGKAGSVADRAVHLILPLTVVLSGHLWYYGFMIRNKLLEELRCDYVLLCKAKGLSRGQLMLRHCLRNVLPSYISLMAVSVPHIIGGTYIVEMVFAYPGLGTLSYESAKYGDYNMLMLLCVVTGVAVILSGMIGRMINQRIDPRIKAQNAMEDLGAGK